jgi:uncharacterized RDD family membrane protein YckC
MIGRRILSFWLDFFLAIFLASLSLFLVRREIIANTDINDAFNPVRHWALSPAHPLIFMGGLFLYFFLFIALFSETPGLSLFGLTLVRTDDEGDRKKIGWKLALSRTLMLSLSILTLGTGFLTVFANNRRLALHDCLSGTRVVRERSFPSPQTAESP